MASSFHRLRSLISKVDAPLFATCKVLQGKSWQSFVQEPAHSSQIQMLFPRSRLSSNLSEGKASISADNGNAELEKRRRTLNRLLYRSKQRGYLELDLLLGKWVEENIRQLDDIQLQALVEMLNLENPDLWKWLVGQEAPPPFLCANPVFTAVHEKIMENLNLHSPSETRAKPGQPWVHGWDDNRKVGGPQFGNQ
eukprot:c24737_g1_i3 orf=363-947(-)